MSGVASNMVSIDTKVDNVANGLVFTYGYFKEMWAVFGNVGIDAVHATYLNNLKDALLHYRTLYEEAYGKNSTPNGMEEQLAHINEHITRLAIDMSVSLLQYLTVELAYIVRLYKKMLMYQSKYSRITDIHAILNEIIPIMHEGKNILHELRASKANLKRVFDFNKDCQFTDEFLEMTIKIGSAVQKIEDLKRKEEIQRVIKLINSKKACRPS